jgi:N utilization substance protein A
MNGDFLEALQAIAKEKEISPDALLETVEAALVTAYKKNFASLGEIKVRLNTSNATFQIFCPKTVIEEGEPEANEILLEEARKIDPDIMVGEVLEIDVTPGSVGRIDAQTAKQVLVQKIRETERDRIYDEYNERVGEVITGTVQRREYKNIFINLGKIEALLPPQEQVESEPYRFNDRLKLYLLEVRKTNKGPQVIISRTHPSLIRRLFELEVPEIAEGVVTIKSVAREPGARSKIAVYSRDEKVDPVGSCVGHRGSRVQAVVNELYDEKIDIIRWNADTSQFIAEALSPAKAVKVTLNEEAKSAFVVVPDNQLSLAIGKSGQNVRLAARLTGWRIDIRSESQVVKQLLTAATTPDGMEEHEEASAPRAAVTQEAATPVMAGSASTAAEKPAEALSDQGSTGELSEDEADESLPMIELPDFFGDFEESEAKE